MTHPPGQPWPPPQHSPGATPYGPPNQGPAGGHSQWPAPPGPGLLPSPPNKGRKKKWVLGVAAVAAAVGVAGVGVVNLRSDDRSESEPLAHPTSTTPAPPRVDSGLPVTALPNLLLTPAEMNAALGTSRFEAPPPTNQLNQNASSHPQCGAVVEVGLRSAYEGSGYRAVQFQYGQNEEPSGDPLADAFGSPLVRVGQMVTAFPDAAAASKFVADQSGKWRQCTHTGAVSLIVEGQPNTDFHVSEVPQNDKHTVQGVLTMELYYAGPQRGNWNCYHSLGAQRNIVADVMVCDGQVKHYQSAKIVERILAKVPAT